MVAELNLSIGKSPQFFVRLDGWSREDINRLYRSVTEINAVTKAEISAGSGMYVHFNDKLACDADVQEQVRAAASQIHPTRTS